MLFFFPLKTGIYVTQLLIHRDCLVRSERMCVCHAQCSTENLGVDEFDILSFNPEAHGLYDSGLPVTTLQQGCESFTRCSVFQCEDADTAASYPQVLTLRVSYLVGEALCQEQKDKNIPY